MVFGPLVAFTGLLVARGIYALVLDRMWGPLLVFVGLGVWYGVAFWLSFAH
jgi:hypothetical protein